MQRQNKHQQLNEGLRAMDLKEMVQDVFEIDAFRSKMGEDKDVCVLSFKVKDRHPARDLMEFIEKGFPFVLDADVSAGENDRGDYSVFVEISRTPKLSEEIKEICYGIKRLTGIDDFKFKYHKESKIHEATETNLKNHIPPTPTEYTGFVTRIRTENVKRFFNKTLMDDLKLDGNVITIYKPFDKQIKLEIVKESTTESILEEIDVGPSVDESSMSEIFWLTKVLGDYNINKLGSNFIFNNGNHSILLKRIE